MGTSSEPTAVRPTSSAKTISTPSVGLAMVLILGGLSAFGPLSIDMYLPAFPTLQRELETDASQIQLTLSACLVGLAAGQVIAGPVSDSLGRRRPLLAGLTLFVLASLACALIPTIELLIAMRFLQGLGGGVGIVIARAVVRDRTSGIDSARLFSRLMLVHGAAPILAPIAGGLILRWTSWRGVFVVLMLIGLLLLFGAVRGLAESHALSRRSSGGLRATLGTYRALIGDGVFLGLALAGGCATAAMFGYISGSPFVYQEIYGRSPQAFSLFFGANAAGFVIVGQLNGRLVGRINPRRLLSWGLLGNATGGVLFLIAILTDATFWMVALSLFVLVASLGFVFPNSMALALSAYPHAAGSASALLGLVQYLIGAVAAPLVGLGDDVDARPMAVVIVLLTAAASLFFRAFGREARTAD